MFVSTLTDQYPISCEEAMHYTHRFDDAYWWEVPEEIPPAQPPGPFQAMDPTAKKVFGSLLQRAYDFLNPTDREVLDVPELVSDSFDGGTLVKLETEFLYASQSYSKLPEPDVPRFSAEQTNGGFTIRHFKDNQGACASYSVNAIWYVVARSRANGKAIFPLGIDHRQSNFSGVKEPYEPRLKVCSMQAKRGLASVAIQQSAAIKESVGARSFVRTCAASTFRLPTRYYEG